MDLLTGKTDQCDQEVGKFFDQLCITISCSPAYSLEVGLYVSWKVATKDSVGSKKNSEDLALQVIFVKQKRRDPTTEFEMLEFEISLVVLFIVELHFLKLGGCVSWKVLIERFLGGKSTVKI